MTRVGMAKARAIEDIDPTPLHPIMRAVGLEKDYLLPDRTIIRVLNDISFDVAEGEFIVLTGQSGCGKTTLLRILMGLMPASQGDLLVRGERVKGCDHRRAMVFQAAELLPWRTAVGNVELGLETQGVPKAERRATAERLLDLVGLEQAHHKRPDQMSGGMRQRVGLARALAVDPDILLMDEPFGALDAHTREALQAELLRLHEEMRKTIIFVTHDLDEAVLLADRVFVLSPVGTLADVIEVPIPRPRGEPEELRTKKAFVDTRYKIWRSMKSMEGMTRPRVTADEGDAP
ncbi:MAG: ABC transporter ATP-binding protein [Rhodospirillum sp.]|nr:ABC transporter ATP-binding protein [Rhodospirillum sp.]MCF8489487.1 ABC transporter ATP-binding protein [Rhodospirillum sp.]